jgi:hypothetical protein
MEFGWRRQNLEAVISELEQNLGVQFEMDDDSETGITYHWSENDFWGMDVQPTRVFDPELGRRVLENKYWKDYSVILGVSDELEAHISRIRYLIQQGLLQAEELPPLPPLP